MLIRTHAARAQGLDALRGFAVLAMLLSGQLPFGEHALHEIKRFLVRLASLRDGLSERVRFRFGRKAEQFLAIVRAAVV